ncbi:MAG: zinc ribbon domain-containing protein [Acidobacteria bacterium]|nr:zinc ribbon domain-containing protein [Acidobacteriota bacterium]
MPIYEYACEACGRREEKLETLSAPETHTCEGCGAPAGMRRQFSVAAVCSASGPAPSRGAGPSCATGSCPFAS